MREILFRGKNISDGNWYYGDYIHYKKIHLIYDCNYFESPVSVIPETVGQYTGVMDIKGNEVFEGDILKEDFANGDSWISGYVVWSDKYKRFMIHNPNGRHKWKNLYFRGEYVIGNIYDNPELIGGGRFYENEKKY